MIDLDFEEQKYRRAMRMISKDALPEVAAETLNNAAEAVEKRARKNAKQRLTIRRKKSISGIKQDRHARGGDIERMYSRTAVRTPWMQPHDEGETVNAESDRIPIPTIAARSGRSKQGAIAKPYKMNVLNIGGGRFFIGQPKGGDRPLGIWERFQNNKRLRLIRNLEEDQVEIPDTGFFSDAVKRFGTRQFIRAQFLDAAKRRLRRFKDTGS